MEYQVKVQGKDTIEKIQIRHIKGMGIVEKLGEAKDAEQNDFLERDDEVTFDQKIRQDLENVDDDFAAIVWQAGMD